MLVNKVHLPPWGGLRGGFLQLLSQRTPLASLGEHGFGILMGQQLPPFLVQPLQGGEGSWHEELGLVSAWAPPWRKCGGLTPLSAWFCRAEPLVSALCGGDLS